MKITLQLLGTGASLGIPVIGCSCSVCMSKNCKNRRLRTAALLTIEGKQLLIDAGPDIRAQLLSCKVKKIDGLFLTHTHFDHIAGLDELRIFTMRQKQPLPCLLSTESFEELQKRYHYLFDEKAKQEESVVRLQWDVITTTQSERLFAGFSLKTFSYEQMGMRVDGVRCGNLAYVTDIKKYPETIFEDLKGVKVLVLGAIRPGSSRVHFSFEEAIDFAQRVGAEKTYFTHMAHEVEHEEHSAFLQAQSGNKIELGYDGLIIEVM